MIHGLNLARPPDPCLTGRRPLQKRNATVAVIGAGDFIGSEIAKKFASEGFTVFAGRRDGAKLEPLVKEIEQAGGDIQARALDARKEDQIISFLGDADVDTEWVRQRRIEALGPNALDNPDLLMPPSSVAESYWMLYQQPKSAWTFELEIRPFGEKW